MQQPIRAILASISISLLLGACASTKETVLPQDGPTMAAIYAAHMNELGAEAPNAIRGGLGGRPIRSGEVDLAGYTREAFNELDVVFPRLPNPTLVMYVFPHLAGEQRTPVPGYATAFPLYERVEYALPGEVATPR
jgi:conjugative transfer region lipoprotein (TIGR03751 family)